MAVKLFEKSGRGTAMVLALAALALPSAAMADEQDGGRGGWRRGGEAVGNINPGGGGRQAARPQKQKTIEGGGNAFHHDRPKSQPSSPRFPVCSS